MRQPFVRTLRLKVKRESYPWLREASVEVNQVWNWAAATCSDAADRNRRSTPRWLSGFDLNNLSSGSAKHFDKITADTIQRVNGEYASKRFFAKRRRLNWRVSHGVRRSLGWVPFKAKTIRRHGSAVRFAGKTFRVFQAHRLDGVHWKDGCFAQDAVGDWWLCLPVEHKTDESVAPREVVGIDLGLKSIATTSDGEVLDAGRWTHRHAERLALAQRRGHKKQAKRIHCKISRQRKDVLHKFSRKIVDRYQKIIVGDVSSTRLAKTRMAKSVLDSGWGMLKTQLQYKGQQAGRSVEIVSERNTTRACSGCGALTGPAGLDMLVVRQWSCSECGDTHDRDVNAARNILRRAEVSASVSGNERRAA